MALTGMDIEQVTALANQLKHAADLVSNQVVSPLNSKIGASGSFWVGSDANKFRSDWESQYKKSLLAVVQGLQAASQSATKNVQEQIAASK